MAAVREFDVAIVGGGMVGASCALALVGTDRRVALIEAIAHDSAAQPSFDERTTALGNASRRIFEGLGVWNRLQPHAAAIRSIHVSQAGRFGFARLEADAQGIEAFGYVIANRVIGAALWDGLKGASNITLHVPARPHAVDIAKDVVTLTLIDARGAEERIRARLVVGADGAQSLVRTAAGIDARVEDYGQRALVVNVAADRPHEGRAYERFTAGGPLAVLPLHDGGFTVVWSANPERAQELLALPDDAFLAALQRLFGWRAGRFVRSGRRASYDLALTRAVASIGERSVLIGNAAQALHPVAGQGFNLGLRDGAMLAELLAADAEDAGGAALLRQFSDWRARDRRGVIRFTDGLVKLFGDERRGVGVLCSLGLLLFDLMPPAKSALARVSAGFGGPTPRLARGLGLRGLRTGG
jgi:2-octaprenyl-6-methoxyphenol hydroxylase